MRVTLNGNFNQMVTQWLSFKACVSGLSVAIGWLRGFAHRMMRRLMLAMLIVTLHFGASSALAADTLRVGYYDLSPLVFRDSTGKPQGLFIDVLTHIAQQERWELQYVHGTWSQSQERLHTGEIDLLVSVSFTEERARTLDFSHDAIATDWGLLYKRADNPWESITDLAGARVSVLRSGIYTSHFKSLVSQFDIKMEFIERDGYPEVIADVEAGRSAAGIGSNIVGLGLESKTRVVRSGIVFSPVQVMFAAKKGAHTGIMASLDRHVSALKADPGSVYFQYLARWIGARPTSVVPAWMLYASGGVLVAAAVLALFVFLLNRQVHRKTAALQESHQNLAITLNSIGDAVIATDSAGRITGMNPTAERLTAWPLADALGLPLSEVFRIINAETRLPSVNPVQLVMERGEVVGLANHTALLARDGREYQIADSAAPIRNPAGDIVGVVLVFSDVTEKYASQEALAESRERYRALSEASFEAIFLSEKGVCLEQNSRAEQMFGYTMAQASGRMGTDWIAPVDRDLVMKNMISGYEKPYEVTGLRQDGSTFPAIIRGKMMHYLNRHVRVTSMSDITERKQTEVALQQSEERWKFAIEGAGDGLWDWNVQTGQAYYSPRYKTMLGFAEGEIGDTADEWSKRIHPDDAPGVFAAMQPYMEGKPGSATVEFRMACKDGHWIWTMGRGMVVERDADGKPLRMIGTNSDITERKQAESQLHLAASVFTHAREGITITDASGSILDVNEAFTRITGYGREEAIGQNPRMLQSGRQDRSFYAAMWDALREKGHWSGEVWNRRKDGEVFAEMLTISSVKDSTGTVQRYVALFSDITAAKEHQSQLEHMAHFDALTNLPNRLLLADRLKQGMAQAQRRGQQLAVAYLDLDGFKVINDRHGHALGDQVLIALAIRMKDCLREGDTLARLGGDEFVAVLIDLENTSDSVPLLDRLLAAAALPVPVGELSLQVSASLGVTFYPQAHDIDADQLLRQADQAMYQAKLAGKSRYQIFDAVQDSSIRVQHESLQRIRLALAQGEFVLHYQPKVNMHSGTVIGAEALIRWQHPEKGLLAPMTFLPVIEDHPLAVDVGEWVIDAALTQMETWHAAGLDLPVSVNISARQLQQADFVARLQAILSRHPHVRPGCIELEILETSALADMAQVSQVIEDCAVMGVKFALDDFGTGYSSLTYLKQLRVALLKIDQSFVRDMLDDPDDLAILQGVIGLASAFKREVIAEGVETVAHGTALLQLGCELAQGYGIARPLPPEQLPAWAAAWQPDAAWSALSWLGGQL